MPLPLLLAAAPVAMELGKTLYTAFNKPKKIDISQQTNALNKIIANNQSDIVSKNLYNSLMSSQKSLGATQYQNTQHSLAAMNAGGQISDSQLAEGLIKSGTDIQGQLGNASGNAMAQQIQSNNQARSKIDEARMMYAQLRDQVSNQYKQDTLQWKNELVGGALDTVTSGFNAITNGISDKNMKGIVDKYSKQIGLPYGQWSIAQKEGLASLIGLEIGGADAMSLLGKGSMPNTGIQSKDDIRKLLESLKSQTTQTPEYDFDWMK